MFNKQERRIIGQLLFDVWTNPQVSAELLRDPESVLGPRGIVDRHGRKFVVLMDTDNSIHMTLPWLPAPLREDPVKRLPADEQDAQAKGLLRIVWTDQETKNLFKMLMIVWKEPREAASLLENPYEYLAKHLSKSALAKLGGRRIVAAEASRHIAHFVVPIPPPEVKKVLRDIYDLKFEVMCSASFCGAEDDLEDSDYEGKDKG